MAATGSIVATRTGAVISSAQITIPWSNPQPCMDSARTALDACLGRGAFDIIGICRLCASSRQLQQQILHLLAAGSYLLARQLLHKTLQQVSAAAEPEVRLSSREKPIWQLERGISWLLSEVPIPQQLIVNDTPHFISIPRIPWSTTKQLVAAGARVTYQQLLSAAHNGLQGIHNWVLAQQQLGVRTDVPAAAEAVCCVEFAPLLAPDPDLHQVPSDELLELFYIALNTLPVAYQHISRLASQLQIAPALSDIDLEAAKQLLVDAVRLCVTRELQWCIGPLFDIIAKLPALRELSSNELQGLCQLGEPDYTIGAQLANILRDEDAMPVSIQLSTEDVTSILRAAVPATILQAWTARFRKPWERLYLDGFYGSLPMHVKLGEDSWYVLFCMLQAAIILSTEVSPGQFDPFFSDTGIWSLFNDNRFRSAFPGLPAHPLSQLLRTAVIACSKANERQTYKLSDCVKALMQLPSAPSIGANALGDLLMTAAAVRAWRCVSAILQSEAARLVGRDIKASVVMQMLCSATVHSLLRGYAPWESLSQASDADAHSVLVYEPILSYLDLDHAVKAVDANAFMGLLLSAIDYRIIALTELMGPQPAVEQPPVVVVPAVQPLAESIADLELSFVIDALGKLVHSSHKHITEQLPVLEGRFREDLRQLPAGKHCEALLSVIYQVRRRQSHIARRTRIKSVVVHASIILGLLAVLAVVLVPALIVCSHRSCCQQQ